MAAARGGGGGGEAGKVTRIDSVEGVLDAGLGFEAIVQQCNCIGCDCAGLAAGIAAKYPYGCPYAKRKGMKPENKFAVPFDRAAPGTIHVRRPPEGQDGPGT
eukprot:gene6993-3213_t